MSKNKCTECAGQGVITLLYSRSVCDTCQGTGNVGGPVPMELQLTVYRATAGRMLYSWPRDGNGAVAIESEGIYRVRALLTDPEDGEHRLVAGGQTLASCRTRHHYALASLRADFHATPGMIVKVVTPKADVELSIQWVGGKR